MVPHTRQRPKDGKLRCVVPRAVQWGTGLHISSRHCPRVRCGQLPAAEWPGRRKGNLSAAMFERPDDRKRVPGEEGSHGSGAWGIVTWGSSGKSRSGLGSDGSWGTESRDRQVLPEHLCGRLSAPKQTAPPGDCAPQPLLLTLQTYSHLKGCHLQALSPATPCAKHSA